MSDKDKPVHAVDFDGTLSRYNGREHIDYDPAKYGPPIDKMVQRVKIWLAKGEEVVILTARVHSFHPADEILESVKAINKFCLDNFGRELPVTCEKHPRHTDLWDDKAVRVIKDTGEISCGADVDDPLTQGADAIGSFLE